LMSLEPAAAALAAMLLLAEFLSWTQWLALACVVAASVGATRFAGRPAQPPPGGEPSVTERVGVGDFALASV